jgi:hypothetical protein
MQISRHINRVTDRVNVRVQSRLQLARWATGVITGTLTIVSLALPLQAQTIRFQGKLTRLFDPQGRTGYDPQDLSNASFSGSYSFDPDTPDAFRTAVGGQLEGMGGQHSARYLQRDLPSGQGMQVQIGQLLLTPPLGGQNFLSRQLDNGDTYDAYRVQVFAGEEQASFGAFIGLVDETGQALQSSGPDADPISLQPWRQRFFQVYQSNPNGSPGILAEGVLSEWVVEQEE